MSGYPPGFADRVKAAFPQDKELHLLIEEGAVFPLGVALDKKEKGHQPLFHELKESCWFNTRQVLSKTVEA
jgi:hypothetical protein